MADTLFRLAVAPFLIIAATATAAFAASPVVTVTCHKLSVNGSSIVPGSTLTVVVNGNAVAQYDQYAGGEIGHHMQPGLNRVGLSFAAPGTMGPFGTQAELRCLPPGVETSRNEVLRLQPTAKRLSAEIQVNYVP